MASKAVVLTPGSQSQPSTETCDVYQPCDAANDCGHLNCYGYTQWVEWVCSQCHEAIGYDRAFFFHQGYFVHAVCLVEYLDA